MQTSTRISVWLRKWRFGIVALMCLIALAIVMTHPNRQMPPANAAEAAQAEKIRFYATTHNFGVVGSLLSPKEHSFAFRNVSTSPVTIARVQADCGCATISFSRESIAPGATGNVRIQFDPQGRKGRFEQRAYVLLTGAEAPCAVLSLRGVVCDSIEINPATLRFGRVDIHSSPRVTVTIRNRAEQSVRILSAKAHGVVLKLNHARKVILPGERVQLSASVTSATPPGKLAGFLELTTDLKGAETIRIPISGWVDEGPVSPSERTVALGFLRRNTRIERTILLRHGANQPFRVKEVTINCPLFKVTSSQGWRSTHQIVVATSGDKARSITNELIRAKATARVDWGTGEGVCMLEVSAFLEDGLAIVSYPLFAGRIGE